MCRFETEKKGDNVTSQSLHNKGSVLLLVSLETNFTPSQSLYGVSLFRVEETKKGVENSNGTFLNAHLVIGLLRDRAPHNKHDIV